MPLTEIQRVLMDIDTHPDTDFDGIVERTGLGVSVVDLITQRLDREGIVIEDSDGWGVSRWGDEIMGARTAG
jgi:hypothetical protein